jgi:hypothetical protein
MGRNSCRLPFGPRPPSLLPRNQVDPVGSIVWHARRALERSDNNEWREHTLWVIKIYEGMLERNKEPEGT